MVFLDLKIYDKERDMLVKNGMSWMDACDQAWKKYMEKVNR